MMHRQSKSLFITLLFVQALGALVLFSAPATAQVHSTANLPASGGIYIKQLAQQNEMIVFSVQFVNENGSKYNLAIYNSAGEVLFRDVFQVKSFDKKFNVPREIGVLDLIVSDLNGKVMRKIKIEPTEAFSVARKG